MFRGVHDTWSQFFDIGKDILSAEADGTTGAIVGQLGNSTDSTADSDRFELWAPPGYYAVPSAPTKGKPSTQALALRLSDHDIVFGTRDPRDAKVVGNLKPGDRVIAGGYSADGTASQARAFVRADGSVTLSTKDDNTADGNDVYRRVDSTTILDWAPWGSMRLDATGYHVRFGQGAKFDLAAAGFPSPFNAYGSTATIAADVARLKAAIVQLGKDQGTSQALVQATAFQAVCALVATALTAIESSLSALGNAGAAGPVTAAVTALGTVSTACATKATTAG